MKQIVTRLDQNLFWAQQPLQDGGIDYIHIVNLFPQKRYQAFHGFGGAFTEAAAYAMGKLDTQKQNGFLQAMFGEDGLRYTLGRVHLGSCDFALSNYAAVTDPADDELNTFSILREEEHLLPMVRRALKYGSLSLLASPWSPPAFMKTNQDMNNGGQLKPEYRALWAKYLAKYVKTYRESGIPITMLSIQNEPAATQTWDSCLYSGEEEGVFAAQYLCPALEAAGLSDVQILVWDHNKDLLVQRMQETLSVPGAKQAIDGFAFHWYTGDHFEAVALAREEHPDMVLYFTEGCVEYSRFEGAGAVKNAEMYAHDILGNLNAGCNGSIDWNLLLDEKGGPNHVGNYCDAPVMLAAGEEDYVLNLSYYYIGHFSRYIQPGAVRIACTRYAAQLEVTAFENPDGSKAVCFLNRTDDALPVTLRENNAHLCNLTIAPHSIVTWLE